MTDEPNGCPAEVEEVAEAYVMHTLTSTEAAEFEDHYAVCNRCAMVLQQTAAYVEAMKSAAAELRARKKRTASDGCC